MAHDRVVVLGLDGVGFDVIERYGLQMPHTQRLLPRCFSGRLISTVPPITAPAWTTMATGQNPATHGLLNFAIRDERSYRPQPLNASHCSSKPIWLELSECGKRVGVFNVPMTYPPRPVNGFLISGLGTPAGSSDAIWPPELLSLLEEDGFDGYLPDSSHPAVTSDCSSYLSELAVACEQRATAFKELWSRESWDFFMGVLMGPDHAHHVSLSVIDPACPDHDPALAEKYVAILQRIYSTIDELISWVDARLGDEGSLLVVSDHGATSLRSAFYVNHWLNQIGLLEFRSSSVRVALRSAIYDGLKDRLPRTLLSWLTRQSALTDYRKRVRDHIFEERIDWFRTRAYASGGSFGGVGQVWVNLKGREPCGTVASGEEYEHILTTIIQKLESLVDIDTGENLVSCIFRGEDVFEGPFADQAPDIVFLTTGMKYCVLDKLDFEARVPLERLPKNTFGGHTMEGICVFRGPFVNCLQSGELSIYDIHPIIGYLQGLPVGSAGLSALRTVFDEGRLASNPPSVTDLPGAVFEQDPIHLTEDEERSIGERLSNLGYF